MDFLKNGFQNTNYENTDSVDDKSTADKIDEKDKEAISTASQSSDDKDEIYLSDERSQMMWYSQLKVVIIMIDAEL